MPPATKLVTSFNELWSSHSKLLVTTTEILLTFARNVLAHCRNTSTFPYQLATYTELDHGLTHCACVSVLASMRLIRNFHLRALNRGYADTNNNIYIYLHCCYLPCTLLVQQHTKFHSEFPELWRSLWHVEIYLHRRHISHQVIITVFERKKKKTIADVKDELRKRIYIQVLLQDIHEKCLVDS